MWATELYICACSFKPPCLLYEHIIQVFVFTECKNLNLTGPMCLVELNNFFVLWAFLHLDIWGRAFLYRDIWGMEWGQQGE